MTGTFFNDDELAELTGKKRRSTQRTVLNAMGITHIVRPDGSIAVMRTHVEKLFGVHSAEKVPKSKDPQPNWDALKR